MSIIAWDNKSEKTLSFSGNAGCDANQIGYPCFADVGGPTVKGEICATNRSSSGNSISSGAKRGEVDSGILRIKLQ